MSQATLLVQLEPGAEGEQIVLAPAVGVCSELPAAGTLVGPGSVVGRLRVLNHAFRLVLPAGGTGRVVDETRARRRAVGYGDALFRLHEVLADSAAASISPRREASDVPPGCRAVTAPTDGVFYRSPEPGAPPFVATGARVVEGQAIGLVEVMKTFNQIVYGGPGWPPSAEVVEIRCADGAEITAGQVLLLVR